MGQYAMELSHFPRNFTYSTVWLSREVVGLFLTVLLHDPGHTVGIPCPEMICLDHPMDTGFKVQSQVKCLL